MNKLIMQAKADLRARMRLRSLEIDGSFRQKASEQLADHLAGYLGNNFQGLKLSGVALCKSFSDEIDLSVFARDLEVKGIPRQFLVEQSELIGWPELIVVPGMAFDQQGNRLGRGKGYFDRLLAQVRKNAPLTRVIGVAYDHQLVDSVPTEVHDQKVDLLCLPTLGLIECLKG